MTAHNFIRFFALICSLVTLWLFLYATRDTSSSSNFILAAFAAWVLLPYFVLYLCARYAPRSGRWPKLLSAFGGLVTVTALYGYLTGTFAEPDPQNGLMFVVFPAYQLLVTVTLLVISVILRRRT